MLWPIYFIYKPRYTLTTVPYKHKIDAVNIQFMWQISNLKTSRQSMYIYMYIYYRQPDRRADERTHWQRLGEAIRRTNSMPLTHSMSWFEKLTTTTATVLNVKTSSKCTVNLLIKKQLFKYIYIYIYMHMSRAFHEIPTADDK